VRGALEQGADISASSDQGRKRILQTLRKGVLARLESIIQVLAAQGRAMVALAPASELPSLAFVPLEALPPWLLPSPPQKVSTNGYFLLASRRMA